MKRLFWILQCGGWGIFFAGMFLAGIGQWPIGYRLVKKLSITLAGFAVLFVGYGDERVLTEENQIVRSSRSVFLKVSYALQR